jgi:hypothetical protein
MQGVCFACCQQFSASGLRDFETVSFQIRIEPSRLLLNIVILIPTSVKDGLAVVEQGANAEIPRPPALHLHFVMAS